jgi:hypothetical protein
MKLEDVQKMARDLMKDPAMKEQLEKDFGQLLRKKVGQKGSDTELNEIYEKLKDSFEHLVTPLGSVEDDKE